MLSASHEFPLSLGYAGIGDAESWAAEQLDLCTTCWAAVRIGHFLLDFQCLPVDTKEKAFLYMQSPRDQAYLTEILLH